MVGGSHKCIFAHSSSVRSVAGGKKKATFAPKRPASQVCSNLGVFVVRVLIYGWQVFCVASDKTTAEGSDSSRTVRLYTSSDWFQKVGFIHLST
jgi:hypothetical protein